jgi:hypothetical protein
MKYLVNELKQLPRLFFTWIGIHTNWSKLASEYFSWLLIIAAVVVFVYLITRGGDGTDGHRK